MTHQLTTYIVTLISGDDRHEHPVSTINPFDAIVMAMDEFAVPAEDFSISVKVKKNELSAACSAS